MSPQGAVLIRNCVLAMLDLRHELDIEVDVRLGSWIKWFGILERPVLKLAVVFEAMGLGEFTERERW